MTTAVRERILDAALGLMAEQGASATSMRQLAKACDVQVAALYHYFDSKEALLASVIAERNYAGRLAEPLAVDREAPAIDRLSQLFRNIWAGALDEEPVFRLLLGEGLRSEPAALPVGRQLLDTLRPGVTAWLADWVPEIADPAAMADILIGQLFLAFIRHLFDPALGTDQIADDIVDSLRRIRDPSWS